jgi:tetratricopeptide (TPR) repeat protein
MSSSSAASSATPVTSATLDVQRLSTAEKIQYLRDSLLRPSRHPAAVLVCAAHVLARGGVSEAERAAFTELAVLAALDCGQDQQADELLGKLSKQFGRTSVRVRRLQGMALEAKGNYEGAVAVYKQVLLEHPTEQFCGRRMCAHYRGIGQYKQAIECLKSKEVYVDSKEQKSFTYTQIYPMDEAAARELISLHWLVNNVSECVKFADEVILFDGGNFLHFNRLAELCAVAGQAERSATAYAHSLRLNESKNNLRAMYGLWHVASQLVAAKRKTSGSAADGSQVAADAAALLEFAATKLRATYAGSATLSYLDLTLKVD